MIFGIKGKLIILTHIMFLSIATNIHVLLMTDFVLQGHVFNISIVLIYLNSK